MISTDRILGFYISSNRDLLNRAIDEINNIIECFSDINYQLLRIGKFHIILWGVGSLNKFIINNHNGYTIFLGLRTEKEFDAGRLEGRYLVLTINKNNIEIISDWLGSIPVYYICNHKLIAVSSIESVLIASLKIEKNDISDYGIFQLLYLSYFVADNTLYKNIFRIPPDTKITLSINKINKKYLGSVVPSSIRYSKPLKILSQELYDLSVSVISKFVSKYDQWILPLSSGFDSRLIGAIGSKKAKIHAFTYGPSNCNEVIFAQQIANALNIPWQNIDLGHQYITKYLINWTSIFGTTLHFH